MKVNKLILLDDDDRLISIRAKLAAYLGSEASLTRSVPGMLEILPPGMYATTLYVCMSEYSDCQCNRANVYIRSNSAVSLSVVSLYFYLSNMTKRYDCVGCLTRGIKRLWRTKTTRIFRYPP